MRAYVSSRVSLIVLDNAISLIDADPELVDVGRGGLARPGRGRLDGARGDVDGRARPRARGADHALAGAGGGAVQPRHAAGAPPGGGAGDLAPPAGRRPPPAHLV